MYHPIVETQRKNIGITPMLYIIYYEVKVSFTTLLRNKLIMERITAAKSAVPNPSITKESPITPCVIINVNALITNKNSPNVKIVKGNVSMIKIGLTTTLSTAKINAANKAVPNPSKWKELNNCATTIKATAFKTKDKIPLKNKTSTTLHILTIILFYIKIASLSSSCPLL